MATAVQSAALGTPTRSSATTAPVREHTCLFTHDLRRKQKRWNDGRLKYHTFNKRVMVHDERGNFIGDAHWREDYDLADGDELELERGGVLIQVGECVGSRDQDLSDLIDKRVQEKAQRQAAAAARRPPVAAVPPLHSVKPSPLPQKHLHNVIGTPSGHHGRAVLPKESPYEERRQKQSSPQNEDTRPAKRQRREISPPSKSGYAQNLFGATLTLSGRPSSQATAPSRSMPRHAPLHAINTQLSMNSHTRLHGSTRPESILYKQPDILDEPENSPIPRKQRRRLNFDQENEINESSIINPQSKSKVPRRTREIDEDAEERGLRTPQSHKPLISGELNRPEKIKSKKRPNSDNRRIGPENRGQNLIDLTEDGTGAAQDDQDQPTTELKIKPRKKRGLLMIAERDTTSDRSAKSTSTETSTKKRGDKTIPANGIQDTCIKLIEEAKESTPRSKGVSKERRKHGELSAVDTYGSENEEPEEQLCVGRVNSDSRPRAGLGSTTEKGNNDRSDVNANMGRRSLRLAQQSTTEDTISSNSADQDHGSVRSSSREDFLPLDEMPPPHLAKLGRKSIKSKEIIGFIFDDDSDSMMSAKHNEHCQEESSANFARDLDKQHLQSKSKVCEDTTTNERSSDSEPHPSRNRPSMNRPSATAQPEEVSSAITAADVNQPKPPINNPATRGKKAAKPSDAAGQMPQCPLSAELTESSLHRKSGSTRATETHDKRPVNPMPGFSRANGGPWSREAYDLFEFKRPH